MHIAAVKVNAAIMHRLVSYFCSLIGCVVVAFIGRTKKKDINQPNGVKPK